MDVVGLLHVLDPFVGLTLGINHQGPTSCIAVKQNIHFLKRLPGIDIKASQS